MTNQRVLVAVLSIEAAKRYGVLVYRDTKGQFVPCTAVVGMPYQRAMSWVRKQYKWKDKRVMGIVGNDLIAEIEGEYRTEYVDVCDRFGSVREQMAVHVLGTPGKIRMLNGFVTTDDEKAELVQIAERTTGVSKFSTDLYKLTLPQEILDAFEAIINHKGD